MYESYSHNSQSQEMMDFLVAFRKNTQGYQPVLAHAILSHLQKMRLEKERKGGREK